MYRKLAGLAALGLLFCAAAAMAADVKGKVAKVNETDSKITLTVDGKDTEYTVHKDCKWPKVKNKKDGSEKDLDLKGLAKMVERAKNAKDKSVSIEITAKVEKKDGKEVVTEIKQEMGGKKKDKKDKDDKKDGK